MTRWGSRSSGSPTTSTSGRLRDLRPDPVDEGVLTGVLLVPLGDDGLEGGGGGQHGRHVLEAAVALVGPVVRRGRGRASGRPGVRPGSPTPGRPAPLVGRRRRAPTNPAGSGQPADRGTGVDEEGDVAQPRRELGDGLHGADLVVGGLAGHAPWRPRGRGRRGRPDRRGRPARPASDPWSRPQAVQHRGVLDGGVHEGIARASAPRCRPSSPRWTASVPDEVKATSSRPHAERLGDRGSRALSRTSRAARPAWCSRRGSAYAASRAAA